MNTKLLSLFPLLAFGTCALAAEPVSTPDPNQPRVARVENGLRSRVIIKGSPHSRMTMTDRMKHYKVPGVSIALINGGPIEWTRGYGVAEAGTDRVVTADTIFQAASISKPVAAMGLLTLVEQGKLDLDEDVNGKLKSGKVPENEFTQEKKVTLRALLNHSAGMTVSGFRGYAADEPVPSLLDVLDGRKPRANSAPIRVDTVPGTKWRYAGGGFVVAQLLAMDVSGKPFPEFMKEAVLDKVGMTQSSFEQRLPQEWTARASAGHLRSGEPIKGGAHTYPEAAAAGLWGTPSDLARFAIEIQKARAGKSNKVLSQKMTAEMLKPGLGNYGLGLETKGEGQKATFRHGGTNAGFRCTMFAYQETGQGAVVMTNGDNGAFLTDEIMRSIAAEYGWPDYEFSEREVAQVDPKIYDAYAGEYKTPNAPLTIRVEGGRLFVKAPVLSPEQVELFPESETKFFVALEDITFTFVKDESGQVTEIVVQPSKGQPITAKRVN